METPAYTTLLDLVQTVNAYAASEDEVVAAVVYLVNSGKVCCAATSPEQKSTVLRWVM
jgi:hypothetical protein